MFLLKKRQAQPVTSGGKILAHLKKVGHYGAYNYELAKVGGLSWHRRVGDLRHEGHNIQCVRLSTGVYKYFLNEPSK